MACVIKFAYCSSQHLEQEGQKHANGDRVHKTSLKIRIRNRVRSIRIVFTRPAKMGLGLGMGLGKAR